MQKPREIYRLVDVTRAVIVAERIVRARGLWERSIGLIGRRSIEPDEGLWLVPCNGVHTFGMRVPIDILVLDGHHQVLRFDTRVPPCRVSRPVRGGYSVVETAAGSLERAGVCIGDAMAWECA